MWTFFHYHRVAPFPATRRVSAGVALATTEGGTYGTDGSTYQTEIADFSDVTAHGTTGNGPSYFTVQGRNGLTYQCGYTDSNGNGVNSQVVLSGTAAKWL